MSLPSRRDFLKLTALALTGAVLGLPRQSARADTSLKVLAPPRTIVNEVWAALTRYGLPRPIPERANSDQDIINGLQSIDYDIVAVPTHLTARLIANGEGQRLQPGLLPAWQELLPAFQEGRRMQDPANAFSAPLTIGALGLIYDPEAFDSPPRFWADLIRYAELVVLPNDPEIVISSLLRAFDDPANQLMPALTTLRAQATQSHDPVGQVLRQRGALTIGGSPLIIDTHLEFVVPEEGSYVWGLDYMIPAGSTNNLLAHAFINASFEVAPPTEQPRYFGEPLFLTPRLTPSRAQRQSWQDAWDEANPA